MNGRTPLNKNDKLKSDECTYIINEPIGEGASSIVYSAKKEDKNNTDNNSYIIKELYPAYLGIKREDNNKLSIPKYKQSEFETYKDYFEQGLEIQKLLRNSQETTNVTFWGEKFELNNTVYIVMLRQEGKTFDKIDRDLTQDIEICQSLSEIIESYHKKNFLCTDIKPQNIFILLNNDKVMTGMPMLFDFDSLIKKDNKEDDNNLTNIIRYTTDYAAPETICENSFTEKSEIYSIGVILYERIFGKKPDIEAGWSGFEPDYTDTKVIGKDPALKRTLTEIFQKTLAILPEKRYENMCCLLNDLDRAKEQSDKNLFLATQDIRPTTKLFGRDNDVEEIHKAFFESSKRIVYLHGMAGIGKSETARYYAEKYKKDYDIVQLISYNKSIDDLIMDIYISSNDKLENVNDRLKTLISINNPTSGSVLIIVDNYTYYNTPSTINEGEMIQKLKNFHFIFTTREDMDVNEDEYRKKIDIVNLSNKDLHDLFISITDKYKDDKYRDDIDNLITIAGGHTMLISLVAKSSRGLNGNKTLTDYIDTLKDGLNKVKIRVSNNKDNKNEQNLLVYEHINSLFNFEELDNDEKYIMCNASLLPTVGMNIKTFCQSINREYDDSSGSNDIISKLTTKGWITQDINQHTIMLHPVIAEVTRDNLNPEFKNCSYFVNSLQEKIPNFKENISNYNEIKCFLPIMYSVAKYINAQSFLELIRLFVFPCVLNVYGKFENAIEIDEKIKDIFNKLDYYQQECNSMFLYAVFYNEGIAYMRIGKLNDAKECFDNIIKKIEVDKNLKNELEHVKKQNEIRNAMIWQIDILGVKKLLDVLIENARTHFDQNFCWSPRPSIGNPLIQLLSDCYYSMSEVMFGLRRIKDMRDYFQRSLLYDVRPDCEFFAAKYELQGNEALVKQNYMQAAINYIQSLYYVQTYNISIEKMICLYSHIGMSLIFFSYYSCSCNEELFISGINSLNTAIIYCNHYTKYDIQTVKVCLEFIIDAYNYKGDLEKAKIYEDILQEYNEKHLKDKQ